VRHRSKFLVLLVVLGLGLTTSPVLSQSGVTHTVTLEQEQLEKAGIQLLREAFELAQYQQLPPALARAELAVQLLPDSSDAWALLGGLYINSKQPEKGIQALETSKRLNPKNPGVHFSLGSAYFGNQQYPLAQQSIEAGLKLKSGVPEALFDLGNTYYKMGNYKKAIQNYELAYKNDEKLWPAINNIGLVHYENGDVPAAIASWKSAVAMDEKASEPKLALAIALYTQGDKEAGLKLAEEALSIDSRYGDVDFLIENLWGDRLIADARSLLETPKIKETLATLEAMTQEPPETAPLEPTAP
jgi:tetratricopeptide (TPR) repeat protein